MKTTYTGIDRRKRSCSSSSGGAGGGAGRQRRRRGSGRGRRGRGCSSCWSGRSGGETIAGDGHVFSVGTVVSAPRAVRTLIETSLTSLTSDVIQPDPS